ncbi:histidinol-phosphatase [uncultured Tyzzerella sp.]|uniref:histidinol-phosphatase n=1 Tax=uncultured Tyzzerella sp. TaxID=2321398 RepID=UPI0029422D04|nr:histidinol-phosphatase [uncultured Tyzzerella sp.]
MKTNYHTHTLRCKHAVGNAKDYVLSAINENLSILGFSDHSPYPDDRFGLRMDFCELEDYIKEVEDLKMEFKNKIFIKSGLEIEYDPREKDYYEELLNKYNLDYLALGQHFYINNNNEAINTYSLNDTKKYLEYGKTLVEAMKTGYFKFIAHPDVIFINDLPWDNNCDEFCNLIVKAAKENDFILEFNANGLRRGKKNFCDGTRYSYPHKSFWYKVAKENIKVIINSDCHNPIQVWDEYMDKAYDMANKLGLNVINEIF